jgi:hypothetical protein
MTLCIAAPCEISTLSPRIVLCADRRLDFGSRGVNDNFRKIAELEHGWTITMASNNWPTGDHLVRHIRAQMRCVAAPLNIDELREQMIEGVKNFVDSNDYQNTTTDLLVCGFFDRRPVILSLRLKGPKPNITVNISGEAECIGRGEHIAQIILNRRHCSPHDSLQRVLYCAYEAKKFS